MTKQETYQLMAVLQAFYPDSFRGLTDEAAQMKISCWQEVLADDPGPVVIAAAKAFAATDTRGFMPSPGQIKEQIRLMGSQDELSEQEAWGLVLKALRNSTYSSDVEFEKLPDIVKKSVGSSQMLRMWAMNDNESLQYAASEFKRSYREMLTLERNTSKIPSAVKQLAEAHGTRLIEG